MAKRAKLVLIDGNAIFHRAYHAIPHLTNKDGLPTNAVYGFANMLLKVFSELKPEFAIVAWDKAGKTFRDDLYSEYKATRTRQPDELYAQMPLARELVEALGVPFIELAGFEADDIIGTLSTKAGTLEVTIVTGDLDELQLINDNVQVMAMRRGVTDTVIYDLAAVRERYGITPQQFIDLKALKGDTSDNIPGVPGVGEKTAMDLIQTYGSLDAVYAHIDETRGKLKERLVENKALAYLSRQLSVIVCDAPVELDLEAAQLGKYDKLAIHELFKRLDFKSLLGKLPPELDATPNLFNLEGDEKSRPHINNSQYNCVQTTKQLSDLVRRLEQQSVFAFDTETDGLDIMTANLVGLAVGFKEGEAYYIPVGHRDKESGTRNEGGQLEVKYVVRALKPVLENVEIAKVGHNLKFDYQIMRRYGVTLRPISFDTMIAGFLLNPLVRSQTLSDLAYRELGIEMIPIEGLIVKKGINQSSFDLVTVEDATRYAAEDADISWRLYQKLEPELVKAGLDKLASELEWPLVSILAEMEISGIKLDVEFLHQFNKVISARILKLEEEIWELAGEKFNIGSPSQLGQVLYGKLGLSVAGVKRGKTGLSTAAKELEKLRGSHPVIELIFEHRELVKLKNTYIDALPVMVSSVDGRVHTSYSQTIAQTGRLSSNNPNLQNIPIRTELGREIRRAFVAPKGRVFVSADYSQFELRIAAALSEDEGMIRAFKDGVDIHAATAAEMFVVPLDRVTKEQRYAAKTINFGVLYGMSAHGLSVTTGMTREESADFIKRYYGLRPRLREFIDQVVKQAHKHEYTETVFGRRRPCNEINSNNFVLAQAAERYAFNMVIQGSQADIMKLAMIRLTAKLEDDSRLLLQIHDELIVETDKDKAEAVAALMKETMESAYELGVPIVVDTATGVNWGEL